MRCNFVYLTLDKIFRSCCQEEDLCNSNGDCQIQMNLCDLRFNYSAKTKQMNNVWLIYASVCSLLIYMSPCLFVQLLVKSVFFTYGNDKKMIAVRKTPTMEKEHPT